MPAPVVPGIVMCCRASSAVSQSSCPAMLHPMNTVPFAGLGLRLPGAGLLGSGTDCGARQAQRELGRRVSTHNAYSADSGTVALTIAGSKYVAPATIASTMPEAELRRPSDSRVVKGRISRRL